MNEQLLQYIWQFQYFNKDSLTTEQGESLQIIHPGIWNTNQGPDFTNARIKIGKTIWAGCIELHLHTSDWKKHGHTTDKNYSNVILHVVYKHDESSSNLPVLALATRISGSLLQRYHQLMNTQQFIPCQNIVAGVPAITILNWKDRLATNRLARKSAHICNYLSQNNHHWEASFWWLLAKNFGTTVNGEAFQAIAKSLPLSILAKHKWQLHQLEALLMGQAGLLNENFEDPYPIMLQKEYRFLQKKYKLQPIALPVHFLRMRPGNFPTVRLAQLAALVHRSVHLLTKMIEQPSLAEVKKWLHVDANDFWHYHYKFDDESAYKPKTIGGAMIDNLIINTMAPMVFAYGAVHQNQPMKDKAMQWLTEIRPERNNITRGFEAIGFEIGNAFDSQSLIELKTQYCDHKKCLHCAIGNTLLKRS